MTRTCRGQGEWAQGTGAGVAGKGFLIGCGFDPGMRGRVGRIWRALSPGNRGIEAALQAPRSLSRDALLSLDPRAGPSPKAR